MSALKGFFVLAALASCCLSLFLIWDEFNRSVKFEFLANRSLLKNFDAEEPKTRKRDCLSRANYSVLVTGGAGFIGMHTLLALKASGHRVVGYDSVNDYYSIALKEKRIAILSDVGIDLVRGNVCNASSLEKVISEYDVDRIIHLAAQAGARYSVSHPFTYVENNIKCFVNLLEVISRSEKLMMFPLIYASSSSVYGLNTKTPFAETDSVTLPASLYASSKRADELIASSYFNVHGLRSIGLRFFTVYGPWGRPDMAPFIFTKRIELSEPMPVFNFDKNKRDFTYVDDIVEGISHCLCLNLSVPDILNLGNNKPIRIMSFLRTLERLLGKKGDFHFMEAQKGDVPITYADISKAQELIDYQPKTTLKEGLSNFVRWFREYNASKFID